MKKESLREGSYEIEKGIPVIPREKASNKYPFKVMEKGDSFFVLDSEVDKVRTALNLFCRRHSQPKPLFTTRTIREDGIRRGIRVWRVE